MKNITISDVAKAAGVSVTTVSRFINQNYGKMSDVTKEKIETVIKQLNYRPSASARRMRTHESKMIGVIVGDISNVFSSLLFSGIYEILQPLNYSVLLLNANNSSDEEHKGINRLLEQQIDGLIIQPSQNYFQNYQFVLDANVPFVTVDRYIKDQPKFIGKVTTNNGQASEAMATELIKLGYQKMILISSSTVETSAQIPRIDGFTKVAHHNAIPIINVNVANHTNEWIANQIRKHVTKKPQKTALVSLMGPLLFKTLSAINMLHLSFPDDIGLTSFDDWNWAQFVGNGIDLIQQDPLKMGQNAASLLLEAIKANQPRIQLPPIIIPAKRISGHSL
ncbi:MAG: LacI family DNA-binding transcriptional regulator [Lentilactobacillus diolivorans]|uniref:LacI family DNA-binding transcriptional regulator n=1 Tax=Lentilactobacillus diolivorans TaxID=179838 RepID=UPI0039EB3E6C